MFVVAAAFAVGAPVAAAATWMVSNTADTSVGSPCVGFTGCSLWIDPTRETWIVLLSNRVHPTIPKDERFKRFRPMLHDAIGEALGL